MTKPKKQYYSTSDMRTPICNKMVACDGNNLVGNSAERGYCGKCKDAMEKKNKQPKPLKGENSALSEKLRGTLPNDWWNPNPDPKDD